MVKLYTVDIYESFKTDKSYEVAHIYKVDNGYFFNSVLNNYTLKDLEKAGWDINLVEHTLQGMKKEIDTIKNEEDFKNYKDKFVNEIKINEK